jgi:predicted nucleic acid-binding protein
MTEYLLDTNVLSETRKRRPHGAVVAWLKSVRPESTFTSVVTIGELQYGIEQTRRQDVVKAIELELWLETLINSAQIVPMDVECFREWARLMVRTSQDLIQDAMIAATARVHHLTVVTRNERDFRHFGVPVLNPFTHK